MEFSQVCVARILNVLNQAGKKTLSEKELFNKVKGKKISREDFKRALRYLSENGDIISNSKGYTLAAAHGMFTATVARINRTFGFVKDNTGTEMFVPGKYLKGAMPGDTVVCSFIESKGESPEAKVEAVAKEGFSEFTGILEEAEGEFKVRPDSFCRDLIAVDRNRPGACVGDKIFAVITRRGERHADHRCDITGVFGSADRAKSSADAILFMNDIETDFPLAVQDEARHIGGMTITDRDLYSRLDLRDEIIFTIDGADTKDIDDAVSIEKTPEGYKLGVHIADVSHYVKEGSELDKDAFMRGTSIYYADKVIPMLPPALSNGICSLNPCEDRLAFSCLMEISAEGKLEKYKFSKTVIRSRVKGVYSEINQILSHKDTPENVPAEIAQKYDGLYDNIFLMKELADILTANKIKRGAPQIETPECKLIVENDRCIDVKRRDRGAAEVIIEEFMLMANESAAKTARERQLPFVFRVHEDPSPEKISELMEVVERLGIQHSHFTDVKPVHLAEILRNSKDSDLSVVINSMVLRSMAKAKYSNEPLGHFGLVLADYAHFTSPIRRYPDLAIHRILTEACYNKTPADVIAKRFGKFAAAASLQSSDCELTAMRVERECEDCYMAEYMSGHLGESYDAMISGVTEYGMYAQLDNTVEGLIKIETLPDGVYEYDGHFSLSKDGKTVYSVGDKVRVTCVRTDIAGGKIDFVIEGTELNDKK
ncbi:MAG: ribonuclease R [Oscillospiraceae bacterium]|nr:ribonuclease R [Oscillospiraceae bacterium]